MNALLKTVICALNSKYIHSSLAPWCLAAGIKAHCGKKVAAKVVEGTINEDLHDIALRISEEEPGVIGLCCYIWNMEAVKKLIVMLKGLLPEAVIVLGGPEVSYRPEDVLTGQPLANYVISGEGEESFAMLLNSLLDGITDPDIPGLSFRRKDKTVINPAVCVEGDPPDPYSGEYFEALHGRIAYLETSRGCPYSCAFCLSGFGKVRFFELERSKKQLIKLANSGTRTVKLVDRTFNADRKRAYELFEYIIMNREKAFPGNVCFHFEIAGDLLDEETLSLLSTAPAGLFQMEIGLQSFNEHTLAAINRKTDIKRLKTNISRLLQNGNIHVHIDLIAGLPYEDLSRFADGFDTAYDLKPHLLQLGFLKLLHGARMRERPDIYPCLFSESPPYEVIGTPWLSRTELELLHSTEDALERLYNSGRFTETCDYILTRTDKTPFQFFSEFGMYCAGKNITGISLDDYTALAFDYFTNLEGIDRAALREVMACDLLSVNPSGRISPALQIKDPNMKLIKRKLSVNKGIAILYSEGLVAYCDYSIRNPVTGRYPLKKLNMK